MTANDSPHRDATGQPRDPHANDKAGGDARAIASEPGMPPPSRTGFRREPSEEGLSLDALSDSLTQLLDQGQSPYGPADDASQPESLEQILEQSEAEAAWPVSPKGIVEAILFVGHPTCEPTSARYLASLMRGVSASDVVSLIDELNAEYDTEGCPYLIESVDNGFRFQLRETFEPVRSVFASKMREAKLSQAAVNVLAVIAYRQPLPKPQLSELLGPSSGRVAGQLIRRGLVHLDRTSAQEQPPDEVCYRTTDRFLALFGLSSLDDLPTAQDLDRL